MLRTRLVLPLCLLAACARDPQPTAAPAGPASAPEVVASEAPPGARQVFNDRSPALLKRALADESAAGWLGRLEAIRQVRRERPSGFAPLLAARAERSRDDLEQAAAIDALALAYPGEAAGLMPKLASSFAGEPSDERRLAASILRYRLAGCHGLALDLLARGKHAEALYAARDLVIGVGQPILPELKSRAEGVGDVPTLARVLASTVGGVGDTTADVTALAASAWPRAAVAAFAEHYRASAIPALRQALAAEACDGRAETITALGSLGDTESAAAILKLLSDADPRERPAFLLALGRLKCAEALPELLNASRDAVPAHGADGDTWPVAQAALAGLARFPGEEAYDALVAALARTSRPAVVVTAAVALADRGERVALSSLQDAAAALGRANQPLEAIAVADARDRLAGEPPPRRDVLAYVLRYRIGDGVGMQESFSIVADQPLLPVDAPGRVLRSQIDAATVTQESIGLTREDVAAAIQLRNSRRLDRLEFAGDKVDEVDLIAR
jgi:hypothetical protein